MEKNIINKEERMQEIIMNPEFLGVVKAEVQSKSSGGILLTAVDSDIGKYTIKYVPDTSVRDFGYDISNSTNFEVGDTVLISPRSTIRTEVLGKEMFMVKLKDIWGYLPKDVV